MRKVLLLIPLIIGFAAQSQEISVKSFRTLPNDLDANTYYPKEDRNGEKAAIIKIVTTETGFEFEAGSIGIVAEVPKTSEIWLYIPHGSKVVTIKHPKLGLLRNYPYPLPIEAGQVYEMVLVTGKVVTTIEAPAIETQWLLISSEPSGTDVYINDQPAGKTPYQNELPTGKYTWRVSQELYLPEAGIIELKPGSEKQKVAVNLKPNFGTLNITSSPENGAGVYLNGIETGKITPCNIEKIPTGDHSITLKRDMYETTTEHLTLAAGETKQVTVNMNPTFAEVAITTEPAADIYINDQVKSNSTWKGRLNPGIYTFEAKLDKFNPAIEKQTVIVGQPLNIKLSPTPKTGNLKIITTPFEATIKIDGKEIGKSPITLKNQLIGDYSVELSLEGYATAFEKATIIEGQTAEINTTLQNGMQVNIDSDPSASDLFLDDKPVEKTPYKGNLSFGIHQVRIENNGKKSEQKIEITQGGDTIFLLTIKSNYTETKLGLNLDMIFVKGGTFQMGSIDGGNEEKPVHSVTLSNFYIGKYEITQKQVTFVMGFNPTIKKNCDNCPVENVSWNDVQLFIEQLNRVTGKHYRLPTEAEWEYAARGGNNNHWYTFSGSNNIDDVAWYSSSHTYSVGQKQANELGLYDMSGNVWEWCNDWYGKDYYQNSPKLNPKGPFYGSDRVIRGGSWFNGRRRCRPSCRGHYSPDYRNNDLGFRLVLVP